MTKTHPRTVPPRDSYYMGLAFFVAAKSKDPNTQIGSVIVSNKNKTIGSGYNGPPAYINDNEINWARPDKYDYIIHAEINAIRHSIQSDLLGATLYVTAPPCNKCMLEIVASGIKKVIYFAPKITDSKSCLSDKTWLIKTIEIAKLGHVELKEFDGDLLWLKDHLNTVFDTICA